MTWSSGSLSFLSHYPIWCFSQQWFYFRYIFRYIILIWFFYAVSKSLLKSSYQEVIRRTIGPRQSDTLTSFPVLGSMLCLPSSHWELFPGHILERVSCLRPSGWSTWLSSVKASIQTFKVLVGGCRDQLTLWLPKTGLICKFLY